MPDDGFDPHAYDVRFLNASQWAAHRRCMVRRVHAARRRAIRLAVMRIFEGVGNACRRFGERQQARDTLRAMSDYELKDIGLARSGIEAAIRSGEPNAWRSTSTELRPLWRTMMSKAYWIVRVSVRDEARYPDYLAAARPAFEKFGAKFIVRGGAFETMEGHARDRNVVVEFADRATAMDCYRSPEYEAAKAIRQQIAEADFIIIDGA